MRPRFLVTKVKVLLESIPGVLWLYQLLKSVYWMLLRTNSLRFVREHPPGHYYSPIPDSKDVLMRARVLFAQDIDECPGVDLQREAQLKLLDVFSHYYNDLPWSEMPSKATRYYYQQGYFSYGDAIALCSFLRHYKPRRVVEVGAGASSAAMLDVNDLFLERTIRFTFVEPYPERLFDMLTPEDKPSVLRNLVQDVPLKVFSELYENDILFVDSSHVVKIGSDLEYILFEILPRLNPGVLVHFHDIFWPFEYPKAWFLKGRAWNEAYFLRSFLQFNSAFEIMYFNSYLAACHRDALREKMPLCLKDHGSSIWIRKVT
jgi:hypothetical protein